MKKYLLWVEDDYYAIKGLFRPLERSGFLIDVATSAADGYHKALKWDKYALIIVDLIMPLSDSDTSWPLPAEVEAWKKEEYAGIGLLKWLKLKLGAECPILLLSIIQDPISKYGLEDLHLDGTLMKRGLLPTQVKEVVFQILGLED